jgi:uncharacterized SAM-binding protein YcdF (DUF218 family)
VLLGIFADVNHIADVLLEPLFIALVLIALSYFLWTRAPRAAFLLPAFGFGVLLVFSAPAVANDLQRSLEQPALTTLKPDVTYDAVIVLGGGVSAPIARETGLPSYNDAVERVLTAFDLLRTNRAKNAILSGGNQASASADLKPESQLVAEQLEAWGIDPSRLAVEPRSTTTHENAVESARIARARGWTRNLLVTSAAHMRRAQGCFTKEGLAVDTLSVDFRSYDKAMGALSWVPRAEALATSTAAIRERAGRFVYRLQGWMD